ncbi:MAG TPA: hypothetical protein VLS89_11455, partial [Candidatus Nanopelagicales bacterium]|nr:hypothetical protein [Candidatus Nanopelagicales bacterium]
PGTAPVQQGAFTVGATVVPGVPAAAGLVVRAGRVAQATPKLAKVAGKVADAAKAAADAVGNAAKKVPNPNGRKGSIPHQDKVNEIAKDIKDRGLRPKTEYHVKTPGGKKSNRFVDVVGLDGERKVVEMHQVGVQTKKRCL